MDCVESAFGAHTTEGAARPTVAFWNDGPIDLDAALVMGVNAKDGDSPIGFFGSGLKYAVAALLRTGHQVVVWRGLERFEFSTRELVTRGQTFHEITLEGRPLGITTALGRNWTVGNALRELYSNALDEGGDGDSGDLLGLISPDRTVFAVYGREAADAWRRRYGTWLAHREELAVTGDFIIRPGSGFYCRGIRLCESPTAFAYDWQKNVKLTEDRTPADLWGLQWDVMWNLLRCESAEYVQRAISYAERDFPLPNTGDNCSQAVKDWLAASDEAVLTSGLRAMKDSLRRSAPMEPLEIMDWQARMIEDAKEILMRKIGVIVTHPVKVANLEGALGRYSEGIIWLSSTVFTQGIVRVTSTLLEEHLHAALNLKDYSRSMQDWLLDSLVSISMRK